MLAHVKTLVTVDAAAERIRDAVEGMRLLLTACADDPGAKAACNNFAAACIDALNIRRDERRENVARLLSSFCGAQFAVGVKKSVIVDALWYVLLSCSPFMSHRKTKPMSAHWPAGSLAALLMLTGAAACKQLGILELLQTAAPALHSALVSAKDVAARLLSYTGK